MGGCIGSYFLLFHFLCLFGRSRVLYEVFVVGFVGSCRVSILIKRFIRVV